jgi:catechol 2,3-dioxygenase-like lactoylglutathione lyase family enzyme
MRGVADHLGAIPILPVRDMAEAVAFWSRIPQLAVEPYDAGYAFVLHAGHELVHLGGAPDLDVGAKRSGCYVHVPDVDGLHRACVAAALPVSEVRDEPWGMREFRLSDPSGNTVRIGRAL